jgi:hypothetical protein
MLPSVSLDGVGTSEEGLFAAQNLAHMPPVNASQPPLRTTAHDSGPMWFAIPSSYETSTHYFSPVSPAHQGPPPDSLLIFQSENQLHLLACQHVPSRGHLTGAGAVCTILRGV